MKDNIWDKLKKRGKPIYALAPMAGINNMAFREMCKKNGADVIFSEMASATALVYKQEKTLELVEFNNGERPYIIQLFGSNPEHFAVATRIITEELRPDGIDINFGCPVPKITKQNAGVELMKDPDLAHDIVKAVIENTNLPVSIKTRTEINGHTVIDLLKRLEDLDIKALTIHGRSFGQKFTGDIDYNIIKEARKYFKGVILANGGIHNHYDAEKMLEKTKADGVAIARGALGNPAIFEEIKKKNKKDKSQKRIFDLIWDHSKLSYKYLGEKGMKEMRKHLCAYVQGLPNAKKLRERLVLVESLDDIKKVLKDFK